jgi:hypothetical protein
MPGIERVDYLVLKPAEGGGRQAVSDSHAGSFVWPDRRSRDDGGGPLGDRMTGSERKA